MAENALTTAVSRHLRPLKALGRRGRTAVVDIGSNSIRLVVFDRLSRAPLPVFNERVLCGLGRGIDRTGRLDDEGIALALTNLTRFAKLVEAMAVDRFDLLATAAVRDAKNGPEFVADVEYRCNAKVTVLSGMAEARLAALGVICGMPGARGVMGDLGGGSLELVQVHDDEMQEAVTLPLGPLRLSAVANGSHEAATAEIDRHLDRVGWLGEVAAEEFYPVGGAWRQLARIHMEQSNYPLHVIHGYTMGRSQAQDLSRVVSRLGPQSLARIPGVSKKRLETLPYAALLMSCVLRRMQPSKVIFSAFGLREGHLFDLLSAEEQARDPLLVAAADLAESEGRFGDLGAEIDAWCAPLFPDDSEEEARLRRAAAHLADIAWREHPDYRAVQALYRLLRLPLIAVDHDERAFLAYTAFIRYGGKANGSTASTPLQLMSQRQGERARMLGEAMRLAITISGGTRQILRRTALVRENGRLHMHLPDDGSVVGGDAVERRLKALAKAAGLKAGHIV